MKNDIGARLKTLRHSNNLSKKQISDYLNMDEEKIAKLESNSEVLTSFELEKLCNLYNCSKEYILTGNGEISGTIIRDDLDLNTIASMNKIIRNLKHLHELNTGSPDR